MYQVLNILNPENKKKQYIFQNQVRLSLYSKKPGEAQAS
jgi:hypothetical protein